MFGNAARVRLLSPPCANVTLRDVEVGFAQEDLRPAFVLHDVADVHLDHVRARLAPDVPFVLLKDVRGLSGHDSPGLPEIDGIGGEAMIETVLEGTTVTTNTRLARSLSEGWPPPRLRL